MLRAVTAHNGPHMVPASEPVTFKLYANRRLYQPRSGRYVTLDDLTRLAEQGSQFIVRDAHTGADITAFILSQPTEH